MKQEIREKVGEWEVVFSFDEKGNYLPSVGNESIPLLLSVSDVDSTIKRIKAVPGIGDFNFMYFKSIVTGAMLISMKNGAQS